MMLFSEWVQTLTPAQIEAWDLDEATIQQIKNRFYYREICDDDKMELFFQRTLDTIRDRYRQILRIETIKFDPMVNKYFEGEYTTNGTDNSEIRNTADTLRLKQGTNWIDNTHHDEDTDTLTVKKDHNEANGFYQDDRNYESEGHDEKEGNNQISGRSNSSHQNTTYDHTVAHTDDSTTTNGSSGEINHKAVKQAPMNASGVGTNGTAGVQDQSLINGALTGLNFSYATAYDANDKTGRTYNFNDEDIDNETTTNGTDGGSASETSSNTHIIHEGTDRGDSGEDHLHHEYEDYSDHEYEDEKHHENDGEYHNRGGDTVRDSNSSISGTTKDGSTYQIKHDRYTGRDGVLPQDALKAAMNYLQNYSTAFEWLCNKLEINFIGIYDI